MANIERDKSEDLSVEELVSKLKNNINSDASPSEEDAQKKQESLKKKHDDGNDIASMLKRFLPEESEQDEFELEEPADPAEDEFEFETAEPVQGAVYEPLAQQEIYEQLDLDAEFDSAVAGVAYEPLSDDSEYEEITDIEFDTAYGGAVYEPLEAEAEVEDIEADAAAAGASYEPLDPEVTYDLTEATGVSYEPLDLPEKLDAAVGNAFYAPLEPELDMGAPEAQIAAETDEFEFAEEDNPIASELDSEFDIGEPDAYNVPESAFGENSLLAGFASVLEETYSPEESQAIAAAVLEANGIDANTGEPIQPARTEPQWNIPAEEAAPSWEAQSEISFDAPEFEDIPTFEGLTQENLSDFHEIMPPDIAAFENGAVSADEPFADDQPQLDEVFDDTQTYAPDANVYGEAQAYDATAEYAVPDNFEEAQSKEAVPTQLYTFDAPVMPAPEEEYYASDAKNPLAFDMDDEGPAVPDESAFAGVDNAEAIEAQMMVENKFSELSEDELNLMVGLGYENQIFDEDSKKKADEIAEKNSSEIVDPIDVDNSFAFDGMELSSSDQFRAVRNRYKQEHKHMKLRLLGTVILTVALLFFETFTALADSGSAVTLGGALNINRYPVVNIMISLQLVVLACSLSWHRLLVGLRDAVLFRPSPISVTSVAILCSVIYDIVMAIIAPDTGLRTYNLTAAVFLLGLVLNDYMNLSREIRAFNTVSTRKPKFALTSDGVSTHLHDEMLLNAVNGGEIPVQERNFEVKSVGFIENYFRRTNVSSFSSRSLNLIILPFIALAVILGIVSYMSNDNAATAFNIAVLTVVVGMPLSSVFISCYPIFAAVKRLFKSDAAIIGDPSVEEYSDATSVVFQDRDVFPMSSAIMRGIKLYDNENSTIYYVLSNLTKLYARVGGPLKEVLAQTTSDLPSSDSAELIRIEDDGVEAVIDGEVRMMAGQRYFMERNGIAVDNDPDDARMASEGVSALFVVLDGVLCAKLYVQYDIDHSFEEIINSLASESIDTYIKTADPCIDDALLASKLRISRFPAKIIKRTADEPSDGATESADSGIVSRNTLGGLADAVVLCNRIRRVRKTSRSVCVVSSVIGVIVMIFLAMFSSTPNILSVYTVIYQLFWLIPMALFTKLFIK